MILGFRLTALAKQDLRSFDRCTEATWGREQRNSYLTKLDASFQLLAQEPQRGKICDDIRAGYRKYHEGRHLIFYREYDAVGATNGRWAWDVFFDGSESVKSSSATAFCRPSVCGG